MKVEMNTEVDVKTNVEMNVKINAKMNVEIATTRLPILLTP